MNKSPPGLPSFLCAASCCHQVVVDLRHLQDCFGRNRAISTFQFRQAQHMHRRIAVSRVYCWHGPAGACSPAMKDYFVNCPAGGATESRDPPLLPAADGKGECN